MAISWSVSFRFRSAGINRDRIAASSIMVLVLTVTLALLRSECVNEFLAEVILRFFSLRREILRDVAG